MTSLPTKIFMNNYSPQLYIISLKHGVLQCILQQVILCRYLLTITYLFEGRSERNRHLAVNGGPAWMQVFCCVPLESEAFHYDLNSSLSQLFTNFVDSVSQSPGNVECWQVPNVLRSVRNRIFISLRFFFKQRLLSKQPSYILQKIVSPNCV